MGFLSSDTLGLIVLFSLLSFLRFCVFLSVTLHFASRVLGLHIRCASRGMTYDSSCRAF
jgi:hypothetical protein